MTSTQHAIQVLVSERIAGPGEEFTGRTAVQDTAASVAHPAHRDVIG